MRFDVQAGTADYHALSLPAAYRDVFWYARIRFEILVQFPFPPLVAYFLIVAQLADDLVLFGYQCCFIHEISSAET